LPRKPQTEEEQAEIRARVVQVAREIYDADGYTAVTMRNVARRIGYSPAALYRYFDNHLALVRSVWQDAVELMQAEARQAADAAGTPIGKIRALMRSYADFARNHPAAFRSTFMQVSIPGADGDLFNAEGSLPAIDPRRGTAYQPLREATAAAIAAGELVDRDPDLVAQTIWGAMHGVVALEFNFGQFPLEDWDCRVDAAMEVVLRGLRP
jgi:AcrR family transcriptional regulator